MGVDVAQLVALELLQAAQHKAVHHIVQQQRLDPALLQGIQVWAVPRAGKVASQHIVDLVLALDHAAFVVGQALQLFAAGGVEA